MGRRPTLTLNVVIAHGMRLAATSLEGRIVLMSVDNGKYYKLDEIGTRVWTLIETPTTIGAVCDRLAEEFHVARARCEADLFALLDGLIASKLIRVVPNSLNPPVPPMKGMP